MRRQGMVPDVITYSALISACERGKSPELAMEVFRSMQRQSAVPDIVIYSAFISSCGKAQQPKKALEAFKAISE